MLCFFYKQKTAYEMRISDWSSDVCSSDLGFAFDIQRLAEIGPDRLTGEIGEMAGKGHGVIEEAGGQITQKGRGVAHVDRPAFGLGTLSYWAAEIGRASCRERVFQYV